MAAQPPQGPPHPRRRSAFRDAASAVVVGLVVLLSLSPAVADAEPPNLAAVPSAVPEALDSAVPAPPIPQLSTIPVRSRMAGVSKELQELREAVMPDPSGDEFFDEWPADVAKRSPGEIFSSRDIKPVAGPLLETPLGYARQLKFASTDAHGEPIFATATLFVPPTAWRGPGPRPVLVNNPPIVALGTKCTTGYTFSHGKDGDTNGTDLRPETTQESLRKGYAVIVPDHTGPRMAYAEPYVAAHIVVDAIRAAVRYDSTNFGRGPIAMLGYSGGAIATNATMKLSPAYAPEIAQRFVGAAIGGVPADFTVLAGAMNANLASGVYHAAILGIARERPEILTKTNHLARWLATSPIKNLCTGLIGDLGVSHVPTQLLSNDADPYHSQVATEIFDVTALRGLKAAAPTFIYHGAQEWWIPASQARALHAEQCALGANSTYREYPGEHMTTVFVAFDDAMTWLAARLRGIPPANGCR